MPSSKVAIAKKRRVDTRRLDETSSDKSDLSSNTSDHQRATNEAILSDAFSVLFLVCCYLARLTYTAKLLNKACSQFLIAHPKCVFITFILISILRFYE